MNHPAKRLVVMLMEDSEKEANSFLQVLNSAGIPFLSFIHSRNFENAETLIAAEKPDIIFCSMIPAYAKDKTIPDVLKAATLSIPLVTLSHDEDEDFCQWSLSMGADDHLFLSELSGPVLKKNILCNIKRKKSTEQMREAIERYELVAKATSDISWDWDLTKNNTYWKGNGIERILNYSQAEMTVDNQFWENNLHPDDKERVTHQLQQIFDNTLQDQWEDEYRFRTSDGEYKFIFDRGFIIYKHNVPVRMVGVMEDITAKVILEKKLEAEKLTRQKQIAEAVITAQEKERTEIGKELHDNVNQLLGASRLYIDAAITDKINHAFLLSQASSFIKNAIEEIRTLSKVLHTPLISELGLKDSIENLAEEIMAVSELSIHLQVCGFDESLLNDSFKLTLYRIVQEQLTNILKHAKAREAWINLSNNDEFVLLEISDNGIGFDTTKKRQGIGISNIYSRAGMYNGSMKLNSKEQEGSTLSVRFPVNEILRNIVFDNNYR